MTSLALRLHKFLRHAFCYRFGHIWHLRGYFVYCRLCRISGVEGYNRARKPDL
jgi:hypothetical protein